MKPCTFQAKAGKIYPQKTSYIFSKDSFPYISRNRNSEKKFLYFRRWNFLIFQEVTFQVQKIRKSKLLIYREMELCSPKKLNKTPLGET